MLRIFNDASISAGVASGVTMSSFENEFMTVDAVLACEAETSRVDAFCLAWIKFERQLRKLTGNLLYQASVFDAGDKDLREKLRAALLRKSKHNYKDFLRGIHRLTGHTAEAMLVERYPYLRKAADRAEGFRNKIFHGLQTGQSLDREDLFRLQSDVREYCAILAKEGLNRFGYDGFARDSLRKTNRAEITTSVDQAINNIGWESFVQKL